VLLVVTIAAALAAPPQDPPAAQAVPRPTFRRVVVDAKFRSEAIAAADVDRDGDKDLLVGDLWYEAPDWRQHAIRAARDLGDGASTYSDCFGCWADDLDADGDPDQLVIGMPGGPARWYRNPGAAGGGWKEHLVAPSACNESPLYVDLFGDGRRVLLMATMPHGEMCWFAPVADPAQPWERHALSAKKAPSTEQFSHGLGAGDVDGDGRADVLVTAGYWSQPAAGRTAASAWPFVAADLGPPCAQMHVLRSATDRQIVSSSAHARGLWLHELAPRAEGGPAFVRRDLPIDVSQTHALAVADVDGDGRQDLVTGKRVWAHGPTGDVDPAGTPFLLWLALETRSDGPHVGRHVIDDASGVGTAFVAEDLDGDGSVDVAVANKKGVFAFFQQRASRDR
jgi:hypothetical protein